MNITLYSGSEGRDAFKSPWQGPQCIEGDRPVVTVSLLGCSTLRVLSHFVCWLGGFCCQKRCSTWVTINHVNPWCSKICLASTGHLAQSSISSTLGDYKPREFMMLENLPGINWTLGTKFNQFNGLVVSNVLLQNCRKCWTLGQNSNSLNGTLPTVCLCCLLAQGPLQYWRILSQLDWWLGQIQTVQTALFLLVLLSPMLRLSAMMKNSQPDWSLGRNQTV